VLTNSCLLYKKDVRDELMDADIVLPSMDGSTEKAYIAIDRPHPEITLDKIVRGIADFTREFKAVSSVKQVWLEVFIVEGVNTDRENVDALRAAVGRINPDRVQLNTLDRPGAESWVKPVSTEVLERIQEELRLPNVEIISKFRHRSEVKTYRQDAENVILETIARRPSTLADIVEVTGMHIHEVSKYIDILESEKKIAPEIRTGAKERGVFYRLSAHS
jgi:wyosine [tRNA(Phe)-imidazoG37] synthetase (radical SAM superfamily)